MYKELEFWEYFNETVSISYEKIKSNKWYIGDLDYRIIWNNKRECIQINFQSTCSFKDWITNFTFPIAPYGNVEYTDILTSKKCSQKMWAARGWMDMYDLGRKQIREQFRNLRVEHPDCVVEIIGHSLGGAMSQICAQDLNYNFGIRPKMITFGSPKPWFGKKTHDYVIQCIDYENSYQFDNVNDIVIYCVPLFGYNKMKPTKVKLQRFCIINLFNPMKFHMQQYAEKELYENIK